MAELWAKCTCGPDIKKYTTQILLSQIRESRARKHLAERKRGRERRERL